MSWMPTSASVWKISRQASSSSFSVNGSPTCTVGRFSSLSSSNSAEAIVAPWMPSRPVLRAHVEDRVADARRGALEDAVGFGSTPTVKAFTRQLPL